MNSILIPYTPEDSKNFYIQYYTSNQSGNGGLTPYKGKRVMGNGRLSGIFKKLAKAVAPLAKKTAISLGKKGLDAASNYLNNMVERPKEEEEETDEVVIPRVRKPGKRKLNNRSKPAKRRRKATPNIF